MDKTQTPLLKQYFEIKKDFPNAILLFRLGDFYEMFFEDAKIAAPLLDIALTARDKNAENPVPLCGIPHHSASAYITKLLDAGKNVALCEQMENPKHAKGIVKRDVVRVITPALRTDAEGLSTLETNRLVCIHAIKKGYLVASLDCSSGELWIQEFANDHQVFAELERFVPKEVLIFENEQFPLDTKIAAQISTMPTWLHKDAAHELCERFALAHLDGLGLSKANDAVKPLWALIYYVERQNRTRIPHLQAPKFVSGASVLYLDAATQEHLNIFAGDGHVEKTTLFDILNQTKTNGGARLLADWLRRPLRDISLIKQRQDAVDTLLNVDDFSVRDELHYICDIERVVTKIASKRCFPRDLVALRATLQKIPKIKEFFEQFDSQLIFSLLQDVSDHQEILKHLEDVIQDEPSSQLKDGNVIRAGVNPALDRYRALISSGKSWISDLETSERNKTGINNLKIGYNRVFGYYVEVTKSQLEKVPSDYIRKQTIAGAERYVTPDLKNKEQEILEAQEKIHELEEAMFEKVRYEIENVAHEFVRTAQALAKLDVLTTFAWVAKQYKYVKPQVTESMRLQIDESRHPVVEQSSNRNEFVSNDVTLDDKDHRFLILTGPNMAGKSTLMRQIGLIALMAHVGSFVPASKAQIPLLDRIFTRVGAADNISSGKSTFMVEMSETANILRNATSRSLVLLDEIGRGTSTYDGLAIAWAVAEYLHDKAKCLTIFATHYHELTKLEEDKQHVFNMHMSVSEWNDQIIFVRKLRHGPAGRSYGIEVAKLAGVVEPVLARAKDILQDLENQSFHQSNHHSDSAEKSDPNAELQLGLFSKELHPLVKELELLVPDDMTPRKALELLYNWKKRFA